MKKNVGQEKSDSKFILVGGKDFFLFNFFRGVRGEIRCEPLRSNIQKFGWKNSSRVKKESQEKGVDVFTHKKIMSKHVSGSFLNFKQKGTTLPNKNDDDTPKLTTTPHPRCSRFVDGDVEQKEVAEY